MAPLAASRNLRRRTRCRLCDGAELERVVRLPATPIAGAFVRRERLHEVQERFPLDLYLCHGCGHVQLLDVVDPRLLFDPEYTYLSSSTGGIVRHFEECAAEIVARARPPEGALAIDIGSNDGSLLRCFQERGLRVLGIDPAEEIARRATESGIETVAEFLTLDLARRIRSLRGPAAVVTAFNVFAHADDLAQVADGVRELLAPDGLFVFEVSYLLDVVDKMLLGTIFHEHLCYHSVAPLEAFLRRHGLSLVDVRRVSIQGGSIIGTAQRVEAGAAPAPGVAELKAMERSRGLDRVETFREFSARIDRLKDQAAALVRRAASRGQTMAAFGAARGGTLLVHLFGLEKALDFIADDSPDKQNLFSPVTHIPVLPSSAIYERKPDFLFILAWVHARRIMDRHGAFADQGGRFVLPFPDVTVVPPLSDEDEV